LQRHTRLLLRSSRSAQGVRSFRDSLLVPWDWTSPVPRNDDHHALLLAYVPFRFVAARSYVRTTSHCSPPTRASKRSAAITITSAAGNRVYRISYVVRGARRGLLLRNWCEIPRPRKPYTVLDPFLARFVRGRLLLQYYIPIIVHSW